MDRRNIRQDLREKAKKGADYTSFWGKAKSAGQDIFSGLTLGIADASGDYDKKYISDDLVNNSAAGVMNFIMNPSKGESPEMRRYRRQLYQKINYNFQVNQLISKSKDEDKFVYEMDGKPVARTRAEIAKEAYPNAHPSVWPEKPAGAMEPGLHPVRYDEKNRRLEGDIEYDLMVAARIEQARANNEKSFSMNIGRGDRPETHDFVEINGAWMRKNGENMKPAYRQANGLRALRQNPALLKAIIAEQPYLRKYIQEWNRANGIDDKDEINPGDVEEHLRRIYSNGGMIEAGYNQRVLQDMSMVVPFSGAAKLAGAAAKAGGMARTGKVLDAFGTPVPGIGKGKGAGNNIANTGIAGAGAGGFYAMGDKNNEDYDSQLGNQVGGAMMGTVGASMLKNGTEWLVKRGFYQTRAAAREALRRTFNVFGESSEDAVKNPDKRSILTGVAGPDSGVNPLVRPSSVAETKQVEASVESIMRQIVNEKEKFTPEDVKSLIPALFGFGDDLSTLPPQIQRTLAPVIRKSINDLERISGERANKALNNMTADPGVTDDLVKRAQRERAVAEKKTGYSKWVNENKDKTVTITADKHMGLLNTVNNHHLQQMKNAAGTSLEKQRVVKKFADKIDKLKNGKNKTGKFTVDELVELHIGVNRSSSLSSADRVQAGNIKEIKESISGLIEKAAPGFREVSDNYSAYRKNWSFLDGFLRKKGGKNDAEAVQKLNQMFSDPVNREFLRNEASPRLARKIAVKILGGEDGNHGSVARQLQTGHISQEAKEVFNRLGKDEKEAVVNSILMANANRNQSAVPGSGKNIYMDTFKGLYSDKSRREMIDSVKGENYTKDMAVFASMHQSMQSLSINLPGTHSPPPGLARSVYDWIRQFNLKPESIQNNLNHVVSRRAGMRYIVGKHLTEIMTGLSKQEQYRAVEKLLKIFQKAVDDELYSAVLRGKDNGGMSPAEAARAMLYIEKDGFYDTVAGKEVDKTMKEAIKAMFGRDKAESLKAWDDLWDSEAAHNILGGSMKIHTLEATWKAVNKYAEERRKKAEENADKK